MSAENLTPIAVGPLQAVFRPYSMATVTSLSSEKEFNQ
jgi:hypothetical protein